MPYFRKKPVVIQAEQWFRGKQIDGVEELFVPHTPDASIGKYVGRIFTLEGTMIADEGDWIITGVKGEKYPCKPDIFEATYESVDYHPD